MVLKQAGATIVGKTTTTAFAANDPTATLNPHNHGHTPGGSSSGSAAAVAAGMIPLALGTQTGGSVIRPASFCGVAAIKPSYRLLPTVGVKCFSWTLDTVGLFAAGVEDLALALAAMTGRPELLPRPSEAPRIGVVTQDFAGAPEAAGAEALQHRSARRGAAPAHRCASWPARHRRGGLAHPYRPCRISRRISRSPGSTGENYDAMPPLLRGRLDESKDITPADYDEARAIALQGARGACARFSTRSTCC